MLDDSGRLRAAQRQDKASMFRVDISIVKAWGAVAMNVGSRGLAKKAKANPNFINSLALASSGRLLSNPGGVAIRDAGGDILGAVGIGGDTRARDETFAVAGIEAAGLVADPGEN